MRRSASSVGFIWAVSLLAWGLAAWALGQPSRPDAGPPNIIFIFYDDPDYADVRAELHAELQRLRDNLAVGEDPVPMPEP